MKRYGATIFWGLTGGYAYITKPSENLLREELVPPVLNIGGENHRLSHLLTAPLPIQTKDFVFFRWAKIDFGVRKLYYLGAFQTWFRISEDSF